jgi:hypothetical protein
MSLETRLNLKTTPEMRDRIRELTKADGSDDYDRAVMLLLDDFASCIVMLGVLAGGESRRSDPKN